MSNDHKRVEDQRVRANEDRARVEAARVESARVESSRVRDTFIRQAQQESRLEDDRLAQRRRQNAEPQSVNVPGAWPSSGSSGPIVWNEPGGSGNGQALAGLGLLGAVLAFGLWHSRR